jgi:lysophospholipase L1-like esterase
VFLGDNITEGGAWEEWLPQCPIRNQGLGGDTTQSILTRLRPFINHPDKIFMMIGTNDIEEGVNVQTIVANVAGILSTIHQRAPNAKVCVQSILPRSSELEAPIPNLNQGVEKLSVRSPCEFIDIFPLCADTWGAIRTEYSDDGVHLRPDGYVVWLKAIRPLILAS